MSTLTDELVEMNPEMLSSSTGAMLGLDVGTSGVRAALFDEHANETAAVKISHDASLLSDFTELDPLHLVEEVTEAIDRLLESHSYIGKIETIAISAFWHSLLGIDAQGLRQQQS
jgi:sugar (pentulose or hexulose) kinase